MPKEHLLIEPFFACPTYLKDFPVSIALGNENYILGAVIMHEEGGCGHFVSYCRRKNNTWEQYDDLRTSVITVDPNKVTGTIQLIIYTKI